MSNTTFAPLSPAAIDCLCDTSIEVLSSIATRACDISNFVEQYRKALKEYSGDFRLPLEGYEQRPTFMNVEIPLIWDISAIISSGKSVDEKLLPTILLRSLIDPQLFDDPYGSSYSTGPIILAELPFCNPSSCVIDGNHRILDAIRKRTPYLRTKLFYAEDHMEYLVPYSQVVFKSCWNIFNYSLYVENKIDAEELHDLLHVI